MTNVPGHINVYLAAPSCARPTQYDSQRRFKWLDLVRPSNRKTGIKSRCRDRLLGVKEVSKGDSGTQPRPLRSTTQVQQRSVDSASKQRRQFMMNTMQIVKLAKGKSIVLSSEASSILCQRSPLDCMSMAKMLGITNQQDAQATVRDNCARIF